MQITPEQYFKTHYAKDLAFLVNATGFNDKVKNHGAFGGYCLHIIHDGFEHGAHKGLKSFADFTCVTYELNLLSEIIYTYFGKMHEEWEQRSAPFFRVNHQCSMQGVESIIQRAYYMAIQLKDPSIAPPLNLIQQYDDYFVPRYAEELIGDIAALPECRENQSESFANAIMRCIQSDKDCEIFKMRHYAAPPPELIKCYEPEP